MTSKISYFKMVKQDFKRRSWVAVVLGLIFMVLLPIAALMTLQQYDAMELASVIDEEAKHLDFLRNREVAMINLLGIMGEGKMIFSVIAAFIAGISGFTYLHSRRKQDLFHSLPVKREKLFLVQQLSGVLLWFLPFVSSYLLAVLIIGMKGALNAKVWEAAFQGLGASVSAFLLPYEVIILVMILTGKLLTAALGMGVFFGYFPLLGVLLNTFMDFLDTYTGFYAQWLEKLLWLTPISPLTRTMQEGITIYQMIIYLLVAAGFLFLSLVLYKIRPTERAEQSMAFVKSQAIIRWLLVIPLSLGIGRVFMAFSFRQALSWLFFGILFGVLVVSGIVEVIYSFDFRKAFIRWKQMVLMAMVSLGICSIFVFDLFGYDAWVPEKNTVESMTIDLDYWNTGAEVYRSDEEHIHQYWNKWEDMEIKSFDPIYQLAVEGAKGNAYSGECRHITVGYRLHNGQKAYRMYTLPIQMLDQMMMQIMTDPDYLKCNYPVICTEAKDVSAISIWEATGEMIYAGSSQDINQKLLKAYQMDLEEQVAEKWVASEELGRFEVESLEESGMKLEGEYPINTTFVHTLECLKEMGLKLRPLQELDVRAISVEYFDENGDYFTTRIKDEAQIQEMLPELIYHGNFGWRETGKNDNYSFEIYLKDKQVWARMKKDAHIPDFLDKNQMDKPQA